MRISTTAACRAWRMALALVLVTPVSGVAAPLLLEFEGYVRNFEITITDSVGSDVETTREGPTEVAFVGTMVVDSAYLAAAASGNWGAIPGMVFRDEDPANTPGADAGIETTEWMRATLTLATETPLTLEFNRDITTETGGATTFGRPYEGNQTVYYREGSTNSPPGGDIFGFELRNRLTFSSDTGDATTSYGRAYDSWIYTAFATGVVFPPYGTFELVDLFGPGHPTSFVWEDPNLDDNNDGRQTLQSASQFSHITALSVFDPSVGAFRLSTARYEGDLVLSRVVLRSAAEPVDVPEPATGALALTGVLAWLGVRRRPRELGRRLQRR